VEKDMKTKKGPLFVSAIVISIVFLALIAPLAKVQAGEAAIFEDDFESGNLGNWNIISGDWEIIIDGGNHIAHLNRSSDYCRILVSKASLPDANIIKAKVKGDADGDAADTTVGFYSNSNGSSFYYLMLGGWSGGKYLTIGRRVNNIEYELLANTSVVTNNNIWYNVEIKLEGGNISGKIWPVGSNEPCDSQISYVGAAKFGEHIVIGTEGGQHNEEFWFDNITVSKPIISISTDKKNYKLNEEIHVTLEINRSGNVEKEMILEIELREPCDEPDMLFKSDPFLMPAVFQNKVIFPIKIDKSIWISGGEYSLIATLRDTSTNNLIDRDTADFEIDDEMPWTKKLCNRLKRFLP
jgi:hypothetical protein